jgi:hypothetical protein
MFSSCFGLVFKKQINKDEKLVDKFLKIVYKISCQTIMKKESKKSANNIISPEESNFFLRFSCSNDGNENRVLKLSNKYVKKIRNSLGENGEERKEEDDEEESYTWRQLRFIIFKRIIRLFEHYCLHHVDYTRMENNHYFIQLIRSMLKENVWLQCLESPLDGRDDDNDSYVIEEKRKITMFILANTLDIEDTIFETILSNDKIEIPITSNVLHHTNLVTNDIDKKSRFYLVKFTLIGKKGILNQYNFSAEKQIRLLGRYIDPCICQPIRPVILADKSNISFILRNHYLSRLFEEQRLFYEERRVVKISALLKLLNSLNDEKFLLPEINKIIVHF